MSLLSTFFPIIFKTKIILACLIQQSHIINLIFKQINEFLKILLVFNNR